MAKSEHLAAPELLTAPTRFVSPLARVRERLLSFFIWSAEMRSAVKTSHDLLDLYWTVATDHPNLEGRELYWQILRIRAGGDPRKADTALLEAEQSFASWPVSRALTFRDVVNYLAVSDLLAAHPGKAWTHNDLRRAVETRIPHDL